MSLAALLLTLRPLLASIDENWTRVIELLEHHGRLAEYEVARFYVARTMAPKLAQMLRSADPHNRRLAARGIRLTCTRTEAARLLRPIVKDADMSVRGAARAAVQQLGLTDVALPDSRFPARRGAAAAAVGH